MSQHVFPVKLYVGIFVTLLSLTAVTVGVAYINLGSMNTVVALVIAAVKMLLVILFFMHLKYGSRLTKLAILAAFFWLALLITITMSDVFTRHWDQNPSGWGPSIAAPEPRVK